MVEYALSLNDIFGSLADGTRRDILRRVAKQEMSVSEVALPYDLSLAAVSKHLSVLERARLIVKRKQGREHIIALSPTAFRSAADYLQYYTTYWESQLDSLEIYLREEVEQ